MSYLENELIKKKKERQDKIWEHIISPRRYIDHRQAQEKMLNFIAC